MTVSVVGIAGSLRAASYNAALLRAAITLAPQTMILEAAAIDEVPLFNDDVEARGLPPSVLDLRARITAADALLIVTPEYNYSIPGVLKNAIDWLSRRPDPRPLDGKPAAIMGASQGAWGTVRAQHHLRQVGVGVGLVVMPRPEVMVAKAQEKFDAAGELLDLPTREAVRKLLAGLLDWTLRLRGEGAAPSRR